MRVSKIERTTSETKISVGLDLDGKGNAEIDTGIGFLDHMLTLFAFHGNFDLIIHCQGDLRVDSHHTVEDLGIVLGQCFFETLQDKVGITRYGAFSVPMDETLVHCHVDVSGRPYLVFNADIPKVVLGNYETEMTEEFFRAFVSHSGITLHINQQYGSNTHHIIEACFKATGRALKEAVSINTKQGAKIASTKGVL